MAHRTSETDQYENDIPGNSVTETQQREGNPNTSLVASPLDLHQIFATMYEFDGVPFHKLGSPVDHLTRIKNLELEHDDVMVCGYVKSGNVWTMTVVHAINSAADLDRFEKEGTPGTKRALEDVFVWEENKALPHPTVYLSHMRYRMLPVSVRQKGNKIIHITRHPKDVAVSFFHWLNLVYSSQGETKLEWDSFLCEIFLETPCKMMYGSWWDYMEDWMRYKDEPHILFIQYEDMVRKPDEMMTRIAGFLGKELSQAQICRIANMLSFDSMKKNTKLSSSIQRGFLDTSKGSFMRKGKIGDWKNYFTDEQSKKFDEVFQDFARRTGWKQTEIMAHMTSETNQYERDITRIGVTENQPSEGKPNTSLEASPLDLHKIYATMYKFDGVPFLKSANPKDHLSRIKNLQLEPDDVMVCGYVKSGNVWTMTVVHAINSAADLDRFEKEGTPGTKMALEDVFVWEENKALPHPAVYLSHIRYHMLPVSVRQKQNKIIHLTRHPKDVAVSYYHWLNLVYSSQGETKQLVWDTFLHEIFLETPCNMIFGSWWEYMEDWMQYEKEPHILFIQYEDMVRKPEEMVTRIAGFLGKELSQAQICRIANMLSFDSMKKNAKLSSSIQRGLLDTSKGSFMRKGKIGDWKNYFTEEQSENFDKVFQEFVKRTGWKQTGQ